MNDGYSSSARVLCSRLYVVEGRKTLRGRVTLVVRRGINDAAWNKQECKELPCCATHSAKRMITIRSSKAGSQVALMCLEATLTTPRSVYSISSEGAMTDSGSSFDGNLFGPISWPVSRFRPLRTGRVNQPRGLPVRRLPYALPQRALSAIFKES